MVLIPTFNLVIEVLLRSSIIVLKQDDDSFKFRSRDREAFEVKFTPPYPAEEIILFRSRHQGDFAVKPLYST